MVRGGALGSAMQAINTFVLEGERVLAGEGEGHRAQPRQQGVDDAIAAFAPRQRAANIEAAKKFGVRNAEAIMAAYLKAQERWQRPVQGHRPRHRQDARRADARGLRQARLCEVLARHHLRRQSGVGSRASQSEFSRLPKPDARLPGPRELCRMAVARDNG